MADIYEYGETDPNKGRYVWIDEEGNANLADGTVLKPGEYTRRPPNDPRVLAARGGGVGTVANRSELAAMRQVAGGLHRRANVLKEIRTVINDSIDASGTIAATGNVGRLTSWVGRLANDIYNGLAVLGAGEFTALDEKGKSYSLDSSAGRDKFRRQYAESINQYLPESFKGTSEAAERFQSLVTEMLYLEARSSEPGAKQFSDADIQRMARIVGEGVNNPEALRKIVLGSYERSMDNFEYMMLQFPPEERMRVMTPEAYRVLQDQRQEVSDLFGQPFGAAAVEGGTAPAQSGGGASGGWVDAGDGVRVRPKPNQ